MTKWNSTYLSDISTISYGYTAKADAEIRGPKFLRITDIQDGKVDWDTVPSCEISGEDYKKYKLQKNDIVFARTGATTGKSFRIDDVSDAVAASYLIRVRLTDKNILPEFVHHFFNTPKYWEAVNLGITGSAQGGFNASKLGALIIPVPPISEQKRIVEILDEAFEGIDSAIVNTEKNLANTRELYNSFLDLHFSNILQNHTTAPLGTLVSRLTNGYVGPTRDIYKDKGIPYLLAKHVKNNVLNFDDKTFVDEEFNLKNKKSILKSGDVLLVQSGHIGHSAVVTPTHEGHNCHAMIVITPIIKDIDGNFLSLFFNSPYMKRKFQEIRLGSTVPHLTCKEVRLIEVPIITLSEQIELYEKFLLFRSEVNTIEENYNEKITMLIDLKQSLLQKAFRGELTADNVVAFVPKAETKSVIDTQSPEFTAHLIAFGYHWHEGQGRQKTYGRVKAQKFLHFSESQAKIEMGRKPIKDAAGPNDFPHMIRGEEWAKSNQFFELVKRKDGVGYDFKKLPKYNQLIHDLLTLVSPYKSKLEKLLSILLPLDTEKSEVLATVYAAWSNLLLDKKEISDDDIIREARNNWHPDKLKISENLFRKAISDIRQNGIVPDGTAKRVVGQESLIGF